MQVINEQETEGKQEAGKPLEFENTGKHDDKILKASICHISTDSSSGSEEKLFRIIMKRGVAHFRGN